MHGLQQLPQLGSDFGTAGPSPPRRGGDVGQCQEVGALVQGELECVGQRVQDRTRDAARAPLLKTDDLVDAHVRELGQLLPARSRDAPQPAVVRETHLPRVALRAAGTQEVAQFSARGWDVTVGRASSVVAPLAMCLVPGRTGRALPGRAMPDGATGWRWAFLINLPVTLIAMAMALRWLPKDRVPDGGRSGFRRVADRIDLPGIVGFATSLSALVILLMGLPRVRWAALAVFVLSAVPTVVWELRKTSPFFDFRGLAANGALARTCLRQALTLLGVSTPCCTE